MVEKMARNAITQCQVCLKATGYNITRHCHCAEGGDVKYSLIQKQQKHWHFLWSWWCTRYREAYIWLEGDRILTNQQINHTFTKYSVRVIPNQIWKCWLFEISIIDEHII
jgi:hypothetical protein